MLGGNAALHRECEEDKPREDEAKKSTEKANGKRRKVKSSADMQTAGASAAVEAPADVCSSDEDLPVFPGSKLLTQAQEIEALNFVGEHVLM